MWTADQRSRRSWIGMFAGPQSHCFTAGHRSEQQRGQYKTVNGLASSPVAWAQRRDYFYRARPAGGCCLLGAGAGRKGGRPARRVHVGIGERRGARCGDRRWIGLATRRKRPKREGLRGQSWRALADGAPRRMRNGESPTFAATPPAIHQPASPLLPILLSPIIYTPCICVCAIAFLTKYHTVLFAVFAREISMNLILHLG